MHLPALPGQEEAGHTAPPAQELQAARQHQRHMPVRDREVDVPQDHAEGGRQLVHELLLSAQLQPPGVSHVR